MAWYWHARWQSCVQLTTEMSEPGVRRRFKRRNIKNPVSVSFAGFQMLCARVPDHICYWAEKVEQDHDNTTQEV